MNEPIEIDGVTFRVSERPQAYVALHRITRDDMKQWYWTAKTPEEVQAYLAGFHAGASGRAA